jgi:hypothetical protein
MPTFKMIAAAAVPALSVMLALSLSSSPRTAMMAAGAAEPTPYSADHARVSTPAEELPATF